MESSQDSVVDRLDELDAETAAFYREQYDDDGLAADVAGAAAKGTWLAGKVATKAALKTTVFTGKALGKVAKLALGAAGGGGTFDGSNEAEMRERGIKAGWVVHTWDNPDAADPSLEVFEGAPLTIHQPRLLVCATDGLHMLKGDKVVSGATTSPLPLGQALRCRGVLALQDEDEAATEMVWLDLKVRAPCSS